MHTDQERPSTAMDERTPTTRTKKAWRSRGKREKKEKVKGRGRSSGQFVGVDATGDNPTGGGKCVVM